MSLILNKSVAVSAGPCCRGSRLVARAEMPFDPSIVVGDRLGRWMKTPFDFLTFGARVSAGALVSAPERLQNLQSDIDKVMDLVQDPRPITEKQEVLAKELEETLLEFVERGADVEVDVLSNIKTMLPQEAANMLNEMIPDPPSKQMVVPVEPLEAAGPPVTYYKQDVAASQIASEISEINKAVAGLKGSLEEIRANADPAQTNIVRLNLREARDQLARRLAEVGDDADFDASVSAAMREAKILLDEVNAQFFNSN